MVKKPVTKILLLTLLLFFGITLQSKQTGGIAFIDGNFKVSCRIEQCQFFSFGYIGIRVADPVDHFISLKHYFKASASPLGFKIFFGDEAACS